MNTKNSQFSFLLNGVFANRELVSLVETLSAVQQNVLKASSEDNYKTQLRAVPQDVVAAWPKPTAQEPLSAQLAAAQAELRSVVVAQLHLAYQPSYEQLKELVTFLRARLNEPLVAEVLVASDLGAGFILEYHGKRIDYSLASMMANTA